MAKELALTEHYEEMNDVITLHLEGKRETAIAKELGIRRADVINYIDEFKQVAKNDEFLRERAQEVVREFDEGHNRIISEAWRVVRDAEDANDLKTRATMIKNLSDISAKRVEVLQKSGLLSDAAIGDQIAEQQEQNDQIMAILREVTAHCNNCKFEVIRRIGQITGKVEPVPVVSDRE